MEQTFNGIIENGNIFKFEYGQKVCIGVTAEAYSQLKNNAELALNRNEELAKEKDKYFNMLVENGIIKKPKSSDERINDLEKVNSEILETLKSINITLNKNQTRLEALENEYTKPIANG